MKESCGVKNTGLLGKLASTRRLVVNSQRRNFLLLHMHEETLVMQRALVR